MPKLWKGVILLEFITVPILVNQNNNKSVIQQQYNTVMEDFAFRFTLRMKKTTRSMLGQVRATEQDHF